MNFQKLGTSSDNKNVMTKFENDDSFKDPLKLNEK